MARRAATSWSRREAGMKFKCILADPPWKLTMRGSRKRAKEPNLPKSLPYSTMSLSEICSLPVSAMADEDCHLWLWTTNQHLKDGFQVMEVWGFKYLAPIHWIKPSGTGNWFIHRTQTLLMGYKSKCLFANDRYRPNILVTGDPKRHSQKPEESYELIESVSCGPRLEMFARQKRDGWKVWGDEVDSDVSFPDEASSQTPSHD